MTEKKQMEEAYKRIYLVEQHLKEIQKDIANISSALVGNKENGNRGFIHDVSDLTQEVTELKSDMSELKLEVSKKDLYISKLEYGLFFVIGIVVTVIVNSIIKG
jgi:chromosome segregation ATPase